MPRKKQQLSISSRSGFQQKRRASIRKANNKNLALINAKTITRLLPRHVISGEIRKTAISIGNDKSAHRAVLWRDAEGSKMYLKLRDNNPQILRAELANDIKKVRESKGQEVFKQGEGFPGALHVDVSKTNPAETGRIVRAAFQQLAANQNHSLHLTSSHTSDDAGMSLEFKLLPSFFKLRSDFVKAGLSGQNSQLVNTIQTRLAEAESSEVITTATLAEKTAQLDYQLAIMDEINDFLDSVSRADNADRATLSGKDHQALDDLKTNLENKTAVLKKESALLKNLKPVIPADPGARIKQTPLFSLPASPPDNDGSNGNRDASDQVADSPYDIIPVFDDMPATGEYGAAPDLNDPGLLQPRQNAIYAGFPRVFTAEIMSVKAFKKSASGGLFSRRSEGYKKTLAALENYHGTLDKLNAGIEADQNEIVNASAEKNRLLTQKYALEETRNSKQKYRRIRSQDIRKLTEESRDLDLNDATGRAKYKHYEINIKKMVAENQVSKNEVDTLNTQIQILNANIQIEDQTVIGSLLDKSRATLQRHRQLLNAQSARLRQSATNYRQDKENSTRADKKNALDSILQQVESPEQDRLRVNKAVRDIYRVENRHLLSEPMRALPSGTASEVYRVKLNGNIGHTRSRLGFAKKATNSENDTTYNLGFRLLNGATSFNDEEGSKQHPNLIARQVLSSRVAEQLNTKVIAPEVFSRAHDGSILGVTGIAKGQAMMNRTEDSDIYPYIDLSHPETQKGLAELQIIDAINGQIDRHMGNIFVDAETGQVTGIDNDMAYPTDRTVRDTGNSLVGQFSEEGTADNKQLVYHQSHIPKGIGERIIALDRSELEKTLRGNPQDLQRIDDNAIEHTLKRFDAVKKRCLQLQQDYKLIDNNDWNEAYFHQSLYVGFVKGGDDSTQQKNYLARAAYKYDEAGRSDNSNIQLPADFDSNTNQIVPIYGSFPDLSQYDRETSLDADDKGNTNTDDDPLSPQEIREQQQRMA